jgi:F-type H+-transporting ATPase subunit b
MEFNVSVFFLEALTFVVGMWLSSRIFLPYLRGWMESRQKKIEDQLAAAERRQKESEVLKAEFEKKVKELESQTVEILQRTRQEANQSKEEILRASRKEAELILSEARQVIESERKAVTLALQREVGTLAVSIAEKIMKASVDVKAQERIVQESVRELGASKN